MYSNFQKVVRCGNKMIVLIYTRGHSERPQFLRHVCLFLKGQDEGFHMLIVAE